MKLLMLLVFSPLLRCFTPRTLGPGERGAESRPGPGQVTAIVNNSQKLSLKHEMGNFSIQLPLHTLPGSWSNYIFIL